MSAADDVLSCDRCCCSYRLRHNHSLRIGHMQSVLEICVLNGASEQKPGTRICTHLRLIGRLSVGLPLTWIAAGNAVGLGTNANATSRCTSSILRGEDRRTTKYPRSFIHL